MKLLNYFSMLKYMICADVKLCIFLTPPKNRENYGKPNFWMYYKAHHLIWDLVFAEKKRFFFVVFGGNQYLACVNEWQPTW